MARPRTALETAGKVTLAGQVQRAGKWINAEPGTRPERWRARTKFRDADGVLRDVERFAPTKGKAETRLREALRERQAPSSSDKIKSETTVTEAGKVWLSLVARPDSNLSDNTREQYADSFKRYVEGSKITGLTLREVNRVPVLESYLQGVADGHGSGAAKTARSVVSNIIGLAVRYRVLEHNAMRDVRPARAILTKETQRDTFRAMTRDERQHVLETADAHPVARSADVSDLIWFMAGTGVRISEALGLRWADVDLQAGTVFVRGTKSRASQRLLSLPPWLAERFAARAARGKRPDRSVVFPSPAADPTKVRDRRNVARVIRQVLDESGMPWATPHTFRRTVATLLDEAGMPIALAANQLGHADPSMTARVYLGRKADTSAAAGVL